MSVQAAKRNRRASQRVVLWRLVRSALFDFQQAYDTHPADMDKWIRNGNKVNKLMALLLKRTRRFRKLARTSNDGSQPRSP